MTEPINLLEKYTEAQKEKILLGFKDVRSNVSDQNAEFGLKAGDIILFKNGYDIEMISQIMGFDKEGKAFLFWDCYWFPIDLKDRLIKKIE